jgi:hypothetical protein
VSRARRPSAFRVSIILADPQKAIAAALRSQQTAHADIDRMSAHIENYLNVKGFSMVSFARIRTSINSDYSDDLLLRPIMSGRTSSCAWT